VENLPVSGLHDAVTGAPQTLEGAIILPALVAEARTGHGRSSATTLLAGNDHFIELIVLLSFYGFRYTGVHRFPLFCCVTLLLRA
jgi:hypothetical protein